MLPVCLSADAIVGVLVMAGGIIARDRRQRPQPRAEYGCVERAHWQMLRASDVE
jgi:hypothetical protein